MLIDRIDNDWRPLLDDWRSSVQGRATISRVDKRVREGAKVYPRSVFRALEATSAADVLVVILGQDPYHGEGQANGLAFSVSPGVAIPPSLRNIFRELQRDMRVASPSSGDLSKWAEQGVLLLNSCLTVEDSKAGSHATWGWQSLTDLMIDRLSSDTRPKVFMLWGAWAQQKLRYFKDCATPHLMLVCNHPSPLSASRRPHPFLGAGHFSQALIFLANKRPAAASIEWQLGV